MSLAAKFMSFAQCYCVSDTTVVIQAALAHQCYTGSIGTPMLLTHSSRYVAVAANVHMVVGKCEMNCYFLCSLSTSNTSPCLWTMFLIHQAIHLQLLDF